MKSLKSYLKTALKWGLFSLWFITLCSVCLVGYHTIMPPATQAQLDNHRLELTEQLNKAIKKEHQQREQALDTISAHLDTLSQRLDAQVEQIGKLSQQQAEQGDSIASLGLDKAALSRLESKFKTLEQRVSRKLATASVPAPPRTSARTPIKTTTQRTSKPVASSVKPPFELFDIQKRGGVYLAIVGKPSAASLSDLSAVRLGQNYLGWRVGKITDNAIHASYQGQDVVMEVKA
ncbi:hypothetical protein I6Y99_004582 [Vibrio parahaemolyticus]|uniref:hypothetical protein n=1 Tax=Vibrio parahaemolyticus TaxID=670 RepID=UPI001A1E5B46|nr:hypothetical protein [Vibrio parahaemolyticus]EGQ7795961.1 hypothetical protein [Vibrio parahaemolyticus]EGQ7810538.1 hypothetical protein [Vibrio parahaemolyticus]EHR5321385.1 hypothetical protein [Vibrio parahaemolyticus]EJB8691210.1 hypothetical protein [Vibrio parahaemolyticus]MCR9780668.1 hypothetical protein [Vibrio parahaemolyticus]